MQSDSTFFLNIEHFNPSFGTHCYFHFSEVVNTPAQGLLILLGNHAEHDHVQESQLQSRKLGGESITKVFPQIYAHIQEGLELCYYD